ncbi:hypothetical protein EST38_g747 [Candolleomyces aberdarensis]|uniref:Zn(2)-C6 fungal-type domain-containing protein n=1 Tax=Candolleomyces aberdarensis TaxID=2316362 RepID=A0A4Q2DXW6_9AGAR|nr:hypothetical protein EST38_g747 [Candolleomyces aberdarensis]
MPPEPTKAKSKHRPSRKELDEYQVNKTHDKELEMKRNRGQASCAECRRLKIKCNRQIPCHSCQLRGCADLCPNESLSTGQRFILAAEEDLSSKISTLSSRIRQLEDALSTLQAELSTEPHPLLAAELVSSQDNPSADSYSKMHGEPVGGESSKRGGSGQISNSGSNTGEVINTSGMRFIPRLGVSQFFGSTGGSKLSSNQESPDFDTVTSGPPYFFLPSSEDISANTSAVDLSTTHSLASVSNLSLLSSAVSSTPLDQLTDVQNMSRSSVDIIADFYMVFPKTVEDSASS